jgi:hypothetical protein
LKPEPVVPLKDPPKPISYYTSPRMSLPTQVRAGLARMRPIAGKPFQSFLGSLLLIIVLPLLPLLFEFLAVNGVKDETKAITAAMYAVGIGFTTRVPLLCYAGILVAILMSFVFGLDVSGRPNPLVGGWPIVCIAIFAVGHAAERFKLHAIDGQPLFEFT